MTSCCWGLQAMKGGRMARYNGDGGTNGTAIRDGQEPALRQRVHLQLGYTKQRYKVRYYDFVFTTNPSRFPGPHMFACPLILRL